MVKLELRDRVEDGQLDLSMSQLEEMPLKEMIPVKHKVKKLDLSNNQLTSLPPTFASQMVLLVELDLSKNQISEVPENFGQLVNLQHLDLYSNKIERLPLSFKDLTRLRWLDLKENPLTPQLAKIAGPCVDQADCQRCAREVVMVMQEISRSIEETKSTRAAAEQERQQSAPKEKKKKRKNKGAGSSEGRAGQNSSSPQQQEQHAEQQEQEATELLTEAQNLASKPQAGAAGTEKQCCAHFPVQLCLAMTRGFLWSLLLTACFLVSIYVASLPIAQPYLQRAAQLWADVQARLATSDVPAMLTRALEVVRVTAAAWAVAVQQFLTERVPEYMKQLGEMATRLVEAAGQKVHTWMGDKAD